MYPVQKLSRLQVFWFHFCQSIVKLFYRQCEVQGLEHLPANKPVLICANHANALVDAVIIQSFCPRLVHPLTRSGLFKNPLLRPVLTKIGAVPIYRRQDTTDGDVSKNVDSFSRVYEVFSQGEVLLVFPEGQSHSDAHIHELKTGAARMALGAWAANGDVPVILPVGLNFTRKGKFRSRVFVKINPPVDTSPWLEEQTENNVKGLTSDIQQALADTTLNMDNWEDVDLLQRIERFFSMRHGKYRQRNLAQQFRALKELNKAYQFLRQKEPALIARINRHLHQFERLCKRCGIRDYHLTIKYRPMLVTRFIVRSLFILFVILPVAMWGIITSGIPFFLTRHLSRLVAHGTDQFDTAKMLLALVLFPLTWVIEVAWVYMHYSRTTTIMFAVSIIIGASAALMLRKQRELILENTRVFFMFVRKKKLRRYLEARRKELEAELASLVRLAKQKLGQGVRHGS